jgi:histidinol-phosphatase (PHP family)
MFDIVGHFDLVTKYNEGFKYFDIYEDRYKKLALDALDALLGHGYIFEINSGAVARGYRKTAYPADFILRRLAEKGEKIMINSDTHTTDTILFGYDTALEFARSCGVRSIVIWENGDFSEYGI